MAGSREQGAGGRGQGVRFLLPAPRYSNNVTNALLVNRWYVAARDGRWLWHVRAAACARERPRHAGWPAAENGRRCLPAGRHEVALLWPDGCGWPLRARI